MDDDALVARLREVDTKHAGDGEAPSAESCRARLAKWRQSEADIEYRCSIPGGSPQVVFAGLCLRFGIDPYRRSARSTSTVCIRAPKGFVVEVLWPLFLATSSVVEDAQRRAAIDVVQRWTGVSLAALDGSARPE